MLKLVLSLLVLSGRALFAREAPSPATLPAQQIYQTLEGLRTQTIGGTELVGLGIKQKERDRWYSTIAPYHTFIRTQINRGLAPKSYGELLTSLDQYATDFFALVDHLHMQYKQAYAIDSAIGTRTIDIRNLRISPTRIVQQLEPLQATYAQTLTNTKNIMVKAQRDLRSTTKVPDSWYETIRSRGKLLASEKVLPNYQQLLDGYNQIRGRGDVALFKFIEKHKATNEASTTELINKLEKIAYIQQQEMKGIFSGLLAKHKKYYHLASEMVAGLLRLYPGAFTIMDGYKITSTENKAALILFLEAGYLNTAYSQLLRQTSELVNLAKQSKAYQRIQQYEKLGKKPAATTA